MWVECVSVCLCVRECVQFVCESVLSVCECVCDVCACVAVYLCACEC